MSSASQSMTKSVVGSGVGAQFVKNQNSPFMPRSPQVAAPFVVEHVNFQPKTGALQPGGQRITYEIDWDGDVAKNISFVMRLDKLPLAHLAGGTASFIRYVDFVGLSCWSEIEVRFGTERVQTIRPEEIYCKIMSEYPDDKKDQFARLLGGGLTPAERSARAQNNANQYIEIPLMTMLGLHYESDPSQALFIRGLGQKLQISITLNPATMWIETDATTTYGTGELGALIAIGALGTTFVRSSSLNVEMYHVMDAERIQLEKIARGSRRMLISDYQYAGPGRYQHAAATSLTAQGAVFTLTEFTLPVKTIYVLPRLTTDLAKRAGDANGSRGYTAWNLNAWYNAGGLATSLPVIQSMTLAVGSNNFALRSTGVDEITHKEQARKFPGFSRPLGLLKWTYEHEPCDENSVTGYLDFEASSNPTVTVQYQTNGAPLAVVSDIGVVDTGDAAALLDYTFVAKSVNVIRLDNMQLRRPYSN